MNILKSIQISKNKARNKCRLKVSNIYQKMLLILFYAFILKYENI